MSAFIDTFKFNGNVYVPHVRTDDGLLQQVAGAPMWGPQEALLALPSEIREAGICGPRGSSKTVALMLDCLSGIGRGFGAQYKAIIFRPSQREFTDLIKLSEEMIRSVWPKSQYNKLKNYWEMPWGESIEFMYMDTPADFKTVQGKAYVFIGFEELQNFEHWECYTLPFSCLRSPIPAHILPRKIRFTCNPSGASHSHIKHRFQLQGVPNGICGPVIEEDGQKRIMIYSDFEQNVLLNRSDPSYMAAVRQSCAGDSAREAAWTRGDWDVVSGGFFDEIFYKYGNTIKEPSFILPEGGHCFFSYDHGGPSPACFLYAWENTDGCDVTFSDGKIRSGRRGDIHIIGELYFWTGQPNEGSNLPIAEMLRAHIEYKIRRGWRRRDPVTGKWSDIMKRGCADTNIWDDSNEQGTVAELFEIPCEINGARHPGIRFDRANKGPNSIAIGGALMRERFIATAPREGERIRSGKGLFVVESECPQFLRTVPVLTRDKRHPEKYSDNCENHCADACRYLLNFDLTPHMKSYRLP